MDAKIMGFFNCKREMNMILNSLNILETIMVT
jgi:hypothetical protein